MEKETKQITSPANSHSRIILATDKWLAKCDLSQLISRANLRPKDIEHLHSIRHEKRRREWLLSKIIVWETLSANIDYDYDGAPVTEASNHISVSHCDGAIGVLINPRHRCGIDIEPIGRDTSKIKSRFLTPSEERTMLATSAITTDPILAAWCAKEAIYKTAGIAGADFINDLKILDAKHCTSTTVTCRLIEENLSEITIHHTEEQLSSTQQRSTAIIDCSAAEKPMTIHAFQEMGLMICVCNFF